MLKQKLSFKDYCLGVENIPYYDMLLPDEYSELEDKYKWYCIDNGFECEFYLEPVEGYYEQVRLL